MFKQLKDEENSHLKNCDDDDDVCYSQAKCQLIAFFVCAEKMMMMMVFFFISSRFSLIVFYYYICSFSSLHPSFSSCYRMNSIPFMKLLKPAQTWPIPIFFSFLSFSLSLIFYFNHDRLIAFLFDFFASLSLSYVSKEGIAYIFL